MQACGGGDHTRLSRILHSSSGVLANGGKHAVRLTGGNSSLLRSDVLAFFNSVGFKLSQSDVFPEYDSRFSRVTHWWLNFESAKEVARAELYSGSLLVRTQPTHAPPLITHACSPPCEPRHSLITSDRPISGAGHTAARKVHGVHCDTGLAWLAPPPRPSQH